MEGIVVVVEPAGPLQWVDLTVAGKTVKGFASPEEELRPGSRAFAHVRPNTVILFDVETGARL
jgi:hypothetical protein